MTKSKIFLLSVCVSLVSAGCSFHYYDKKTQTEHIVGFGHMMMKASSPEEDVRAVVTGVETMGLGLSRDREDSSFIGGWHKSVRMEVVDEDSAVSLKWPNNDMFNVRVGSKPPFLDDEKSMQTSQTKGGNK